jgi:two-component system response regulator NreC
MIKTIIVDDHPVIRFGVRHMLSASDQVEVVADVDDARGLTEMIREKDVSVVLLDLELKGDSGVDTLGRLREESPDTRVIIYTAHDDEERIVKAAQLGMDGYLLKGCGQQELVNAIVTVHEGGTALEPRVAGTLMKHMNTSGRQREQAIHFSKREKQVLKEIASGKKNRQIGEKLFISESTVKFHVHAILTRLNASNRTEAVSIALKLGLLDVTERENA